MRGGSTSSMVTSHPHQYHQQVRFICLLLSSCKVSRPIWENSNVVVCSFPSLFFMPLSNLWFIRLQGQLSILRKRSCPGFHQLICPPRRPLPVDRGRILIPRFIQSPSTLTAYDVAHSLPLGGVDWDFPFTENETRRHFSELSGTFREHKDI